MDNSFRIMNLLGKNWENPFTINEISQYTKIPYATTHRTIQEMLRLGMILEHEIGNARAITLNLKNGALEAYLTIGSIVDAEDFLKNKPLFKKIIAELPDDKERYFETVALFGSFAKREENEKSDIDIFVLNRKGNRSLSFAKYEVLFKRSINPIFVSDREFIAMLKSNEENIGKQVLKNHIILKNPRYFWHEVLDAIR